MRVLSCFRTCTGLECVGKQQSRRQDSPSDPVHEPAAAQQRPADGAVTAADTKASSTEASVLADVHPTMTSSQSVTDAQVQNVPSMQGSRARSSELSLKGLQEPTNEQEESVIAEHQRPDSSSSQGPQAVSSDDVILQPHGPKNSVVASRGDSAADALLDKDIAPVLKQQPIRSSEAETDITLTNGHPDLSLPPQISLSDTPIIQADPVKAAERPRTVSETPSNPGGSLYDKLGGPEALEAAVDLFYEKVLDDDRLKHFFEGTNMMRLVIKQVQFMVYAFGGNAEYKGKDLKAAHFHLVTKHGLHVEHFDMVAGHFQATLEELGVAQEAIDEAMQTLGSVRSSFDPKSYIGYTLPSKLKIKASALKDPTAVDTLANLIPASKAEEALVRKAGSKGVVMAAVRVFYMRVMNDDTLRPFFEDIDLARLKNKLVSFLAYAFGGGVGHQLNFQPRYKGRDLAFMHSHMVDKGLNMDHFDAVLKHFCQTLRQLNMPQSAIDEASTNLNKTREGFAHVINKAKQKDKEQPNFISTDLIANMQGDKAALLAEVQARMVANPDMAKGIGLDPIDPAEPDLNQPVLAAGVCPMGNFNGKAPLPKGRRNGSGGCPMGH